MVSNCREKKSLEKRQIHVAYRPCDERRFGFGIFFLAVQLILIAAESDLPGPYGNWGCRGRVGRTFYINIHKLLRNPLNIYLSLQGPERGVSDGVAVGRGQRAEILVHGGLQPAARPVLGHLRHDQPTLHGAR